MSIYPCQSHDAVTNKSLFLENAFTSASESTYEAEQGLSSQANSYFLKQIDSYLMTSGIRPVSSKMRKYADMLKKGGSI